LNSLYHKFYSKKKEEINKQLFNFVSNVFSFEILEVILLLFEMHAQHLLSE